MKKQKAFTLIELLVVIAIIALLMAILIPTLRRAKEQAKKTICTAHTKGLVLALILYIDDYDGKTHRSPNVGLWDHAWDNPPIITESEPDDYSYAYWGIAYFPYAKSKEIFRCPSTVRVDDWPEWGWGKSYQIYFKYCSYGLNGYIDNKKINTAFKRHSEVIAFQDHIEQLLDDNGDMFHIRPGESINLPQWRGGGTYGDFPDGISECFRHSRSSYHRRHTLPEGYATVEKGLCVTSWLDGHVSEIQETTGEDVPRKWYRGIPD